MHLLGMTLLKAAKTQSGNQIKHVFLILIWANPRNFIYFRTNPQENIF